MRHADMDSSARASQASQVVSPAIRADISDTTKPLYLRPLGDGASTASCGCVRCSSRGGVDVHPDILGEKLDMQVEGRHLALRAVQQRVGSV